MTARAVLVGAGRIGCYHLLGLLRVPCFSELQVVEPNLNAAQNARRMIGAEAARVSFVRDVAESWTAPDLTVVATQADDRPALIAALLTRGHRTFLIEKMVCQSESEYAELMHSVRTVGARAWVNTPLRYNPLFQEAAEVVRGHTIGLSVVGSDLGLGSNAIHFAALFLALRGEWQVTYERSGLEPRLLPNKRGARLVEFGGVLIGRELEGNVMSVANLPFAEPVQTITLTSEPAWWFVDVVGATSHTARRDDGWRVRSVAYRESRVSEITTLAAEDILRHGTCRMPTLLEMEQPHRALFRVFRQHIAAVTGTSPDRLPIT